MKHDATGWASRALTDEDRAEIASAPAPEGTAVYFYGVRPPRAASVGRPADPGWYSACITRHPAKWYGEGASPIAAFRTALAAAEAVA